MNIFVFITTLRGIKIFLSQLGILKYSLETDFPL